MDKDRNQSVVTLHASSGAVELGDLVAISTSTGVGYPASDLASRRVVGVALEAGANGETIVVDRSRAYEFKNGTAAIDAGDIGNVVYVEDAKTVQTAGGSNDVIAGVVVAFEDGKVYVDTSRTA